MKFDLTEVYNDGEWCYRPPIISDGIIVLDPLHPNNSRLIVVWNIHENTIPLITCWYEEVVLGCGY